LAASAGSRASIAWRRAISCAALSWPRVEVDSAAAPSVTATNSETSGARMFLAPLYRASTTLAEDWHAAVWPRGIFSKLGNIYGKVGRFSLSSARPDAP